mmetsp:Transcript_29094/g.21077  ORF Transcript_29094/g.21077 Transcript_29094/m.21077 type:complete len:82 (-) Transcript_29094:105-350(-)
MFQADPTYIMGPDNRNLQQVIKIFTDVLDGKYLQEEKKTKAKIVAIFKQMQTTAGMSDVLQNTVNNVISPEAKQRLEAAMQ